VAGLLPIAIELMPLMRSHHCRGVVQPLAFRHPEPHASRQRERKLDRVMRMRLRRPGFVPDPEAGPIPQQHSPDARDSPRRRLHVSPFVQAPVHPCESTCVPYINPGDCHERARKQRLPVPRLPRRRLHLRLPVQHRLRLCAGLRLWRRLPVWTFLCLRFQQGCQSCVKRWQSPCWDAFHWPAA